MDDFNTIRLKKKIIDKFKKYSKKISPSYSETLDFMIAFFEDNNLSPYDTLRMSNRSLLNVFNKRMDAVVSIFRNVEETQLKPTKEMLESLFKGIEETEPLIKEKKVITEPSLIPENKALDYYRQAYYKNNRKLTQLKYHLNGIIRKTKLIKNTFGANYYSLKLTLEEYNMIQDKLKNDTF